MCRRPQTQRSKKIQQNSLKLCYTELCLEILASVSNNPLQGYVVSQGQVMFQVMWDNSARGRGIHKLLLSKLINPVKLVRL